MKKSGRKPNTFESMGTACLAALIAVNFTHPIEVVKVRDQFFKSRFGRRFKLSDIGVMLKSEGVGSFYQGLSAGYLREASYTSLKLGLYPPLRNALGVDSNAPFYKKFLAGCISGTVGALVGNPFDMMKNKMMAQVLEEGVEKLTIRSICTSTMSTSGFRGFFKVGLTSNVARACVLNGTKMAIYDQVKGIVCRYTGWSRKELKTQFCGGIGAGACMTLTVTPFDGLRARIQGAEIGEVYYGLSLRQAAAKVLKTEGPLGFYSGWKPLWVRFATQATIMLLAFEKLLKMFGFDPI